jgi:hypothetical protein
MRDMAIAAGMMLVAFIVVDLTAAALAAAQLRHDTVERVYLPGEAPHPPVIPVAAPRQSLLLR